MPSLKPMRLRGVAWSRSSSWCCRSRAAIQRSSTSAAPDARAGCARRGRRPAGRRRRPGRTGRRRCARGRAGRRAAARAAAARGPRASSPKRSSPRSSNSAGPKPTVTVSRDGRQPVGLAGVGGRDRGLRPRRRPSGAPRSCARAAAVHVRSSSRRSARVVGHEVEGARSRSRSCAGVAMPAWCAPWKATTSPRRRACVVRAAARRPRSRRRRRAASPRAPPPPSTRGASARGGVESPARVTAAVSDLPRDERERLGERVDLLGELAAVGGA